jgi:hypothetical protein
MIVGHLDCMADFCRQCLASCPSPHEVWLPTDFDEGNQRHSLVIEIINFRQITPIALVLAAVGTGECLQRPSKAARG